MEKTATMNLRINPLVKQGAEEVLKELGIPIATAIDIFTSNSNYKRSAIPCSFKASTKYN